MTSPFLTTEEVAIYLRFVKADGTPNLHAVRKFLAREKVRCHKRGRTGRGPSLVHIDDLKAVMTARRAS